MENNENYFCHDSIVSIINTVFCSNTNISFSIIALSQPPHLKTQTHMHEHT